jgi:hypothetical protein
MEKVSARLGSARGHVVVGLLVLAVLGTMLVIERPWTWCPANWSGASRIDLGGATRDVTLDGKPFRVGGSALLDYSLRAYSSPLDTSRAGGHPLSVVASISASSREALGEPVFTCFRAIHGSEVWTRRPPTYATQTMADGYPPGAPPPVYNEAWRMASVNDGPEWPDGDQIGLELWATVNGRNYVFVIPAFALTKGL